MNNFIVTLNFLISASILIYIVFKINKLAEEHGIMNMLGLIKSKNAIVKQKRKRLFLIFCIPFIQTIIIGLLLMI